MSDDSPTKEPSTQPSDSSADEGRRAQALSNQQRALVRALDNRDAALSRMYRGAIGVLSDASNPDRFAQCAHSIRELMEKLPELLDVPTKAQKESLKGKVREIEQAYSGAVKRSNSFSQSNTWDGDVDAHLAKFLRRLGTFFQWFATHHPRRREELHGAITRMDGSGRELPKPLASLNVDAWDKIRNYFQSVAHHRHAADEKELQEWIDSLEIFLLDRLAPRTFEDFAELDTILGTENEND